MNTPALLLQRIDFGTRQIRFIGANVQVIDEFLQRATSIQAKSNLVQIMKASVSFGDVVGKRDRRASELASKFKFLERRKSRRFTSYIFFRNSRAN